MHLAGNDRWETSILPEKEGILQFQVVAWPDPFTTWKNGLFKKYDAGLDIETDLEIGRGMLEAATKKARTRDRALLQRKIEGLKKNPSKAVATISDEALAKTMFRSQRDGAVSYLHTPWVEVERRKAAFSSWYELFPRSTSPDPARPGTFLDVIALLPRIAEMGFDVLYLPPVHPIGKTCRKGKDNCLDACDDDPGSPWAIGNEHGGHKSIDPGLGTMADFQNLLAQAKHFGIDIALDLAFQCSPDHPYVKEHPEWFRWRPDGTIQHAENPPKKYEDIVPFDFETHAWKSLWAELKSIVDHWVDQGIRIFRVDNPHTKPFALWEWLIGETRNKCPEIIFLSEAFTKPKAMEHLAKIGFSQSYTYFTWRNTKKALETYMNELLAMRHWFRPNFWPNTPDILSPYLSEGGENAHIIRLILAATLSSNYGLYGPVYEFGHNTPAEGREEYADNEKYEVRHWDWDRYTRLGEIISRVNRIRRENPALQTTWNIEFAETTNDQVLCYTKISPEHKNALIIAVNLDPFHTQSAQVDLPAGINEFLGSTFHVRDLLSGDKFRWNSGRNYVELNPYQMPAHIFKIGPIQAEND